MLICSIGHSDERLTAALRDALDARADLVHAALVHGVAPLLYHRLQGAGLSDLLPPEQWERLKTAHVRRLRRQEELLQLADEAAQALRAVGARFVAIKGLALLSALRGEQIWRDMVDLDLLIPPGEIERGVEALRDAGWEQVAYPWAPTPWEYHLPQLEKRGLRLEPHWRLWPTGPLQPFALPDAAALAAAAHRNTIPAPDLPTQLLICAAGMAVEGLAVYLRHWADLYGLAQRLDGAGWETLWRLAEERRMADYVRVPLALVGELWPDAPQVELSERDRGALATVRPIAWRRLDAAPVQRASFWMLLALRRDRRCPMVDPQWREQLPPHVRGTALQETARAAMAQTGGAFVAGSKLLRRVARWAFSGQERRALREELALSQVLWGLASG